MAESPIQSSFIPRDAAQPSNAPRFRSTGLYDLFILVAVVLFIASAVLAVGVFLYVQFLQSEGNSKLEQLQRAKEAFQPALIQKLTRLDDRMHAADELLAAHIAPTTFFKVLEQVTLTTISFSSLDFQSSDAQNMNIKMSGTAQSVNSVALQADLFSKSNMLTSPIFSGINRQGNGVNFNVTALLNPSLLRYAQAALASQAVDMQSGGGAQQATTSQEIDTSPFTRGAQ